MRAPLYALLSLMLLATPVLAVQPDEILQDPALEARARELSQGLRCLVCRNENIDDSNAELARDLRLLLRERLVAGDSDEAAVAFIVDRYGEYVLLNPTTQGTNLLLWLAGPLMLLGGLGISLTYLRRRRGATETPVAALSEAEKTRLDQIMRD
ncbi:cytochrome c-type biogenesis protein [Rhodobacter ferrooxidans]|uniref:Cytochrome c-type biogenesis protein n=1 Tax=Rhodobacter ferrooxidans TaxID=371731 RepID=C8S3W9_9RHOB|nr:cytochrome c-type biogenesis protein [Rhodobacter sp. SW2]EEW24338.1 cytochrome C biogenesis protein [Rhodobacter sp. SW2]